MTLDEAKKISCIYEELKHYEKEKVIQELKYEINRIEVNENEIKNAKVTVTGFVYDDVADTYKAQRLECIITNNRFGKTLSINDGKKQFTIPFEAVEKYLR